MPSAAAGTRFFAMSSNIIVAAGRHLVASQQLVIAGERRPSARNPPRQCRRSRRTTLRCRDARGRRSAWRTEPLVWTSLRPGRAASAATRNRIGRYAGEVDFVHVSEKVVGIDSVDRHQSTQGRAVLAENRPSAARALTPATDPGARRLKRGHISVNLVEEPARGGVRACCRDRRSRSRCRPKSDQPRQASPAL